MHPQTIIQKPTPPKTTTTTGLTMVELIVTLAILGILLSVSAVGLLNYTKHAAYKRNTEYAQSIFTAAQSALTHYRVTGKLESFKTNLDTDFSAGTNNTGSVSAAIKQYAGITENRSLYYIYIPKGLSQSELKNTPLYELINNYIYDNSIYQAAIRIEFDPSDGTVLSVCYSDQADQFNESNDNGETGIIGIAPANRAEEIRKKIILGYYDTALSDQRPSDSTRP